jgi:histidine triad (HIT) family protein
MSEDCIFCGIVAGEIPGHTVYEDDHVTAFLDANPLARGHTLVVPNDHYRRLDDIPDDVATHFYDALHRLVPVVEAAVDADGTNVGINNGEASGQEIPHAHYHIIPRVEGDGGGAMHSIGGRAPNMDDDELAALADDIAATADR